MKDKLVWPLIVVLVVCIGVLVLCPDLLPGGTPAPQTSALSQQEHGQLAVQLSELTHQQERVRKEFEQQIKGVGTLTLMFTDFGPHFVEQLLPTMDKVSLTGTLAFTDTKYPGAEGCLTLAQWHELQTKGWTCCLYWDGAAPLDAWLTQTTARLTQLGLPTMDVLCFAEGMYSADSQSVLEKHGIANVVYRPDAVQTYYADIDEDGIVEVCEIPLFITETDFDLAVFAAEGESFVTTIYDEPQRSAEDMEQFRYNAEVIAKWHNTGVLLVTDVVSARAHRLAVKANQAALSAEMEQTLAALQLQIDAITQQMNSLLQ